MISMCYPVFEKVHVYMYMCFGTCEVEIIDTISSVSNIRFIDKDCARRISFCDVQLRSGSILKGRMLKTEHQAV